MIIPGRRTAPVFGRKIVTEPQKVTFWNNWCPKYITNLNPLKNIEEFRSVGDEELVSRISKSNNTLLFGVLYDRYSQVVYNKCLGFVKNEEEAQDLVQDIFLKLFIKLRTFQGKSKFSTWLYALTYNHCVNYLNRDIGKKMERHSVPIDSEHDLYIEVDDNSLFQIQLDRLQKALELIPPEDKMVLLMKYQDDVSIKDMAEALDLGESAVKMRLKRAKAHVVKISNSLY